MKWALFRHAQLRKTDFTLKALDQNTSISLLNREDGQRPPYRSQRRLCRRVSCNSTQRYAPCSYSLRRNPRLPENHIPILRKPGILLSEALRVNPCTVTPIQDPGAIYTRGLHPEVFCLTPEPSDLLIASNRRLLSTRGHHWLS